MSEQGLAHWNENVRAVCGHFETRYERCQSLFIGEIRKAVLGATEVAFIRSNAQSIARARRSGAADDDPHCFLVLQQQGAMTIELGDHALDLHEGDLALLDSSAAMKMVPHGLFAHVSIHLPRGLLTATSTPSYGKLNTAGACGQVLRALVRQVAAGELAAWACPQDGAGIQAALLALLGPVLEYREPARNEAPLLREAQALIQQLLASPRLTPTLVAQSLGVSSRQLYRTFEAQGEPVCRYIQRERLNKAAADLTDPAWAHRSITDVGLEWGFADSAHFSKAFKKQMGVSPRAYRMQCH